MNPSVTLDHLVSQSNGDTFHFSYEMTPLSLLKEVILRGFQVRRFGENNIYSYKDGSGVSFGRGSYGYSTMYRNVRAEVLEEFPQGSYLCFGESPGMGYSYFERGEFFEGKENFTRQFEYPKFWGGIRSEYRNESLPYYL